MDIAVTATSLCKRDDLKAYAQQVLAGHSLRFCDPQHPLRGQELISFTKGASAIIVGREPIDRPFLDASPTLRIVSVYGVGTDNIDVAACEQRGVSVAIAHGVNAQAAAEHTLGLMLAVCRNIASSAAHLAKGQWVKDGGVQLSGRTVAIVGCGHIGAKVGHLLTAMSCPLLLVDIIEKPELAKRWNARQCSYEEALSECDMVTFHVPLTKQTQNMLSTKQINLMRPGSMVINTSRGGVVDEEALRVALIQRHLRGAGLDVFAHEPLKDPLLYKLPNLVATPHIAGNAYEAVTAMGKAAIDKLATALSSN